MSFFQLQRVPDSTERSNTREPVQLQPPVVLGRGSLLKCADKKVSRSHASVDWDDEGILVTAMHIGPTYVKTNGKCKTLNKGESIELKNGDQLGLLPTTFWFRIIIEDSKTKIQAASSNRPISTELNNSNDTKEHPMQLKENLNPAEKEEKVATCTGTGTDVLKKNQSDEVFQPIIQKKNQVLEQIPTDENLITEVTSSVVLPSHEKDTSSVNFEYKSDRQRNLPKWLKNLPQSKEKEKETIKSKAHGQSERRASKKNNISPKKTKVAIKKNPSPVKNEAMKGLHFVSDDEDDNINLTPRKRKKSCPNATAEHNQKKTKIESEVAKSNDPVAINKEVSPLKEVENVSPTIASVSNSPTKADKNVSPAKTDKKISPKKVEKKVSAVKAYHSMSLETDNDVDEEMLHDISDDEEQAEINHSSDSNDEEVTERQPCIFADRCYRRNPAHKREYAHPGDDDYVLPMDIDSDDEEDDGKPECEFGVNCFRKNPKHKEAFKHTRYPQPRRKAAMKTKKNKKNESSLDDDYDFDDSFIDDNSSDDYAPTESDTDSPIDDDGASDEENDGRRMLKEAKTFIKNQGGS